MEPALFSPMTANIIIILIGTLSVVALLGAAYNSSVIIGNRDKFKKIDKMEHELKQLQQELKALKKAPAANSPTVAAPSAGKEMPQTTLAAQKKGNLEQNLQPEVWQKFVDDYNNLANSMNVPKAVEACTNFVRSYKLELLVCVASEEQAGGAANPIYASADDVEQSVFWAWNVTGQPEDFAVVPNPLVEYNEKIHHQGGMKETFASNYENGAFHQIQVKLPAHFSRHLGHWKIVQPGVIRLK